MWYQTWLYQFFHQHFMSKDCDFSVKLGMKSNGLTILFFFICAQDLKVFPVVFMFECFYLQNLSFSSFPSQLYSPLKLLSQCPYNSFSLRVPSPPSIFLFRVWILFFESFLHPLSLCFCSCTTIPVYQNSFRILQKMLSPVLSVWKKYSGKLLIFHWFVNFLCS